MTISTKTILATSFVALTLMTAPNMAQASAHADAGALVDHAEHDLTDTLATPAMDEEERTAISDALKTLQAVDDNFKVVYDTVKTLLDVSAPLDVRVPKIHSGYAIAEILEHGAGTPTGNAAHLFAQTHELAEKNVGSSVLTSFTENFGLVSDAARGVFVTVSPLWFFGERMESTQRHHIFAELIKLTPTQLVECTGKLTGTMKFDERMALIAEHIVELKETGVLCLGWKTEAADEDAAGDALVAAAKALADTLGDFTRAAVADTL